MSDIPSLDSCWEKVKRADENIISLNAEMLAFINDKPYEFIPENYFYAADKFAQWRCVSAKDIPLRLNVLTGEIVHHLRSSLDLMVYQLVRQHTKADPVKPKRIEFPVLLDKPTTTRKHEADFKRHIEGVSPSAEASIETLQPYYAGDGRSNPFFILHELDIIDKHRLLVAMVNTLTYTEQMINAGSFSADLRAVHYSIKPGAIIINRVPNDPEMEVKPDFTFDITFGESGLLTGESIVPTLQQMSGLISNTLDLFSGEF